ncbi:uncharacterized protein LOC122261894 [Penaeus japonicus]|uniref:uncharacterized protein LOC122261894 n=1 Tax=Penaeus japonicus TaxID=27405 RepID=UPI001C711F46|nr:uncharacterized protein LOC122261894 [Penaeus japonicus]
MRRKQDTAARAVQETKEDKREIRLRKPIMKKIVELKGVSAGIAVQSFYGGRDGGKECCPNRVSSHKEGLQESRSPQNTRAVEATPQPPQGTPTTAALEMTAEWTGASPSLINSTSRLAPCTPGGDGRIRSRSNGS